MKLINVNLLILFFVHSFVFPGDAATISKDGDYIIEFILSIHDGDWKGGEKELNMANVLAVEAIISTMEKINEDRTLLPNVTLGYTIHDDYGSKRRATEIAMSLMNRIISNGQRHGMKHRKSPKCHPTHPDEHWINPHGHDSKPVIAVIGGTTSDIGMRIATILRPLGIPIISYMATSDRLRSVHSFPFFMSLLPSDKYQAKAIMDLADEFKWSYVLVIVSTSYYGIEGLAMLEKEAAKRVICLHSQTILIPRGDISNNTSIRKAVEQIKKDKRLTVVIVFMYLDDVKRLFEEVERQNVTGITWIASEAWAEDNAILNFPPRVVLGSLGVKLVSRRSRILNRVCRHAHTNINIWLIPFFCQHHNISKQNCSQMKFRCLHNLFPSSIMYIWGFAENAVRTVAQALEGLVSRPTAKSFDYAAMLDSMKSMRFIDSSSRAVEYTNYIGPSVVKYAVVNLQSDHREGRLRFVQVGSWAKDLSNVKRMKRKLSLRKSSIQWNAGQLPQSRCSKPCKSGYKTNQGPHRCCWHCEPCPTGHISNSDIPHQCVKCALTEHPSQNQNRCMADTQTFIFYNNPIGIALLTVCSLGEVLGCVLFTVLKRWNNHNQYIVMPYRKLSYVITVVGFLQPLTFLLRTSSYVCRMRIISFIFFLNTHACFLFCSCGKVRHLVVRVNAILERSPKRSQKTMMRKAWTRNMRIKFVKERNLKREGREIDEQDQEVEGGKSCETEMRGIGKRKRKYMRRLELEKAEPMATRKISGSKKETKIKEENGERLSAGKQRNLCHVITAFTHHALFFATLILSILPLALMKHDSMTSVKYIKLKDTVGYFYCTWESSPSFPLFLIFHFLHLIVTLVLTNQTKTIPTAERNDSKDNGTVNVSLFYVHDRFVYYLSYLILLIECICVPFSLIVPGPPARDILHLTMGIVVQYSFILTTYGTKLYVICREQYKNK